MIGFYGWYDGYPKAPSTLKLGNNEAASKPHKFEKEQHVAPTILLPPKAAPKHTIQTDTSSREKVYIMNEQR